MIICQNCGHPAFLHVNARCVCQAEFGKDGVECGCPLSSEEVEHNYAKRVIMDCVFVITESKVMLTPIQKKMIWAAREPEEVDFVLKSTGIFPSKKP